jgi:hypothetical protein
VSSGGGIPAGTPKGLIWVRCKACNVRSGPFVLWPRKCPNCGRKGQLELD